MSDEWLVKVTQMYPSRCRNTFSLFIKGVWIESFWWREYKEQGTNGARWGPRWTYTWNDKV